MKKMIEKEGTISIKLFNEDIHRENTITFLGIRFDPQLSFGNQINYVE